jgi:hypothetical protein
MWGVVPACKRNKMRRHFVVLEFELLVLLFFHFYFSCGASAGTGAVVTVDVVVNRNEIGSSIFFFSPVAGPRNLFPHLGVGTLPA